ncbi:hypothetical protein AcV5_004653 [Taiwanofungus camphoratus]|nr:hypothetical protein AcW2_000745 [Antrodia cinnamomea]KAI0936547.1 hypothetical protein AcV5_004653 [Antrodia cinnamomea]KAI0961761.1 hypothetical protein AcV7_000773 [Antrodia cinnamomea]
MHADCCGVYDSYGDLQRFRPVNNSHTIVPLVLLSRFPQLHELVLIIHEHSWYSVSKEGQDVLCVATTTASQIYIIQHSKQTYLGDMDRTIAQARGSTHTLLPSSCAKTAIHRHVPAAS